MRKLINLLNLYRIKCNIFNLFYRIFTKSNLNKAIIIFTIGFISRILVNNIYGINVYLDYLNTISFIYYITFSLLIVFTHELITYFDINIIPSFSFNIWNLPIRLFDSFLRVVKLTYSYINLISILNHLKFNSLIILFRSLLKENINMKMLYTEDINPNIKNSHVDKPEISLIIKRNDALEGNSSNKGSNIEYSPSIYSNDRFTTEEYSNIRDSSSDNDLPILSSAVYNPNLNNNFNANDVTINELPPLSNRRYSGITEESIGDKENSSQANNISSQTLTFAYYPNVVARTPIDLASYRNIRANAFNEDYSHSVPNAPRPSNLSTPSTMTPLFPSSDSLVPEPLNVIRRISASNILNSSYMERNRSMAHNYMPGSSIQQNYVRSPSLGGTNTLVANTPNLINKQNIQSPNSIHPFFKNERLSDIHSVKPENLVENTNVKLPIMQDECFVFPSKEIKIEKKGISGKLKLKFTSLESKIISGKNKIELI